MELSSEEKRKDSMVAWIRETGDARSVQRVIPKHMGPERGWGGTCVKTVAQGDALLSFHCSLLMDRCAAERSEIGPLIMEPPAALHTADWPPGKSRRISSAPRGCDEKRRCKDLPSMAEPWTIILLLLHELGKGQRSFWFPYIDMLPKDFDNALHFSAGEAALLDGTDLGDELLPEIQGDEEIVQRVWEDVDSLGYTYIWQCLLSF